MTGRPLTLPEQILLGRICIAPMSGYGLKQVFAATPMGLYQPSSGALYPALHALSNEGWSRCRPPPSPATKRPASPRLRGHPGRPGRPRELALTLVDLATVAHDLGLHSMRFAMMEHAPLSHEVLEFLQNLANALTQFTAQLEQYAAAAPDLGGHHPRLALAHGLAVYRASLRWAEHAIAELSAVPAPTR